MNRHSALMYNCTRHSSSATVHHTHTLPDALAQWSAEDLKHVQQLILDVRDDTPNYNDPYLDLLQDAAPHRKHAPKATTGIMQQTVITQHSPRTKRPRTTSTGNGVVAKVSVAGADVTTMVGAGVAPHGIRGGVVAMTEKAMDGGAQKRRKLLNNEVDRIKSLEAENGQLDFSVAAFVEPQRVLIRGCYQVAEQKLVHFANNKIQRVSRSTQPVWALALQNIEAITPQT